MQACTVQTDSCCGKCSLAGSSQFNEFRTDEVSKFHHYIENTQTCLLAAATGYTLKNKTSPEKCSQKSVCHEMRERAEGGGACSSH